MKIIFNRHISLSRNIKIDKEMQQKQYNKNGSKIKLNPKKINQYEIFLIFHLIYFVLTALVEMIALLFFSFGYYTPVLVDGFSLEFE